MATDLFTGIEEQNEPRDLFEENGMAGRNNNDTAALYFRQGEGPSMFDKVLSFFGDKEKEGAKAIQALVDSEALGISPGDAYRYRDQIDQGVKLNPAAVAASRRTTLTDRIRQSWETGVKQNRIGEIGYKYIMTGDPKYLDDIQKEHLPTDNEIFISEGQLETAVREAAKMLPMMFDTMKEGAGKGLGVGMAAGGAMALLGQAGPQVAIPEEIVTVPAASLMGFKIGSAEGAFESALRKESGLAVADIINFKDAQGNQIDPNLARAASFGIGVINAGIEVSQLHTLLKTVPGLDKIFSKAVLDTVTNKTVKQRLAAVAAEYAKTNISETGQEVAQESTNIVFEELAKQINNATKGSNIDPAKINDIFSRLYDTAAASAQAFAVIQLPGSSVKAGKAALQAREGKTSGGGSGKIAAAENLVDTPEVQKQKARTGEAFIIGVNDDNGDITGFTMADPVTGKTFDVPAVNKNQDADADTVSFIPDPETTAAELQKLRDTDLDDRLDQIIQGDIDAETAADEILGRNKVPGGEEDVPGMNPDVSKKIKRNTLSESSLDSTVSLGVDKAPSNRVGNNISPEDNSGNKEKLYDISSVLNPVEIVNNLRGLSNNIKEAMPHLEALGRHIYDAGKVKFEEWSDSMKETLGDLWESFKDVINQVFEKLKEERGSISNRDAANADPLFDVIEYIKQKFGGLNYDSLRKDWSAEDLADLMKRRPGVVTKEGTGKLDEVAQEFDMDDNKLMMDLLSRKSKKAYMSMTSNKREEEYLKAIYENEKVMRAEFVKAIGEARKAFKEGNAAELARLKGSIKWMAKRKESIKNVRDYFGLTDNDMSKIVDKNPLLMDEAEFKQFLKDVEFKAMDSRDNKWAKIELMNLVEQKRLKKVDNYRRAMNLPPINQMTTDQLKQFARLLEPFQDDDIFLTQRELETVDRTKLKGIRTWREAREKLAEEAGVSVGELAGVKVEQLDSFKWDSALREKDPFFDLLVNKMTTSILGADMKVHEIESFVYDLAKKAEKSRNDVGLVDRIIPKDDLIFGYLEAPYYEKNSWAQQMTPEQLRFAHYINLYFKNALSYLMSIKSVERGRSNYFVHIRKSFLENLRDKGIKEAVGSIFEAYQEDQMGFNILDDNTGNILPLEKFFQYSLHRTGELDPTHNIVRAFMTYVRTFERKKMFDAIIPELDIYAQSLTPTRYTPRGLEYDQSLKKFVNKYINNKKGRKISYDSVVRQGGPIDMGIRALRTFTTVLDLGLSIPVGVASFVGEQAASFALLGPEGYAKGIARMRTDQGKAILKKYEAFTERSFWENFTAPGKEITDRFMEGMFGLFHVGTTTANKQCLLGMLSEDEFKSGELSTERLAALKLEMGRFRVVPNTNSLVGSTSIGNAVMQYKTWAVPIINTLYKDSAALIQGLRKKQFGEVLTSKEASELYRVIGLTTTVLIVGAMAGANDPDNNKTFIGKLKTRMYREAMTLMQGIDPKLWLSVPRIVTWLAKTGEALHNIVLLESYKTKDGLKGVDQMKKQFTPGAVRSFQSDDKKQAGI